MTAAVLMLLAGIVIGVITRSESAQSEAGRWHAVCNELRARCGRLAVSRDYWRSVAHAEGVRQQTVRLGGDAWLLGALEAAHREVRPGERAENLTIQVRWKDSADMALIGIDLGQTVAERAVLVHVTDGESSWQQTEDIDIPPSDSPEWHTG